MSLLRSSNGSNVVNYDGESKQRQGCICLHTVCSLGRCVSRQGQILSVPEEMREVHSRGSEVGLMMFLVGWLRRSSREPVFPINIQLTDSQILFPLSSPSSSLLSLFCSLPFPSALPISSLPSLFHPFPSFPFFLSSLPPFPSNNIVYWKITDHLQNTFGASFLPFLFHPEPQNDAHIHLWCQFFRKLRLTLLESLEAMAQLSSQPTFLLPCGFYGTVVTSLQFFEQTNIFFFKPESQPKLWTLKYILRGVRKDPRAELHTPASPPHHTAWPWACP